MPTSTPPLASGPSIRVLPRLDATNEFFWTSGADGVLRLQRCGACRRYAHPPVPRCPYCLEDALAPEAVSGRGRLHSFTVNHQQWIPGSDHYVVGLVTLEEQHDVRLMTNIVDCAEEDLAVDMAVEVVFEPVEDVWLPLFKPART
ncbi:MAG TPA: OB-fold domain-containing protein [Acidimicrobiales bacterium]|nr:OB-fold domain-containing protein [Acidimicrobiales bacterium]